MKSGTYHYHPVIFCRQAKDFVVETGNLVAFLPFDDFKALRFSVEVIQPSAVVIKSVTRHEFEILEQCEVVVEVDARSVLIKRIITKKTCRSPNAQSYEGQSKSYETEFITQKEKAVA